MRLRVLATLAAVAVMLGASGCAEQRIRNDSRAAAAAGDFEKAVAALDDGLKKYPDSSVLRSGAIQARSDAVTRLSANAAAMRAAGRLDDAERELTRARALDPENSRVASLLASIETERRQSQALVEAEQAAERQQPEQALLMVAQALKDYPRHNGLLALQRRLETELRQAQQRSGMGRLAEVRPISLDFREASLRTVLDAVSRSSGVNFILDKDIRADIRVTVFLKQSRVEDALDLIVGTNQLAKKVVDSQTVIVYPNTPEKQREYLEQFVRVFYLASADAKGAAQFLRSMLKIREPFVDERTNMLALRESQENIQLAERLIGLYDTAEPEVLLEVEVIEISSSALTEIGVKLPNTFSLTPLPPAGVKSLTLGNIEGLNRERLGLGLSDVLVNLRREVGDFNTLANPRIRVRNREKAKVLIGDKIPVITTTTSGTSGFVADSVNYLDVGLKLDVEPTVYPDDDVAIRIGLEVSSLGSSVKTNSGTLAYQIGTRNATTLLRLHDGETQLLAGLISRDDRTSSSRVPGIGDLPLLGRLFSNQSDNATRTELVLAITPRVLRNVRRPGAAEAELPIGTETMPRLRVAASRAPGAAVPPQGAQMGAPSSAPMAPGSLPWPRAPSAGGVSVATSVAGEVAGPTLSLGWQGPAEAPVGQGIEVGLTLNSSLVLRGMPVEIMFDPGRLELVEAVEGDYFRKDSAPTTYSHSANDKDGRLKVGILRSQATGVQGKGTVLNLKFKALQAGPATVQLVGAQAVGLGSIAPPPALPPVFTVQIK